MTRTKAICRVTVLGCFLWALGTTGVEAETTTPAVTYTFTKIADNQGIFNSFNQPAINADGTVAFNATLDGGGTSREVKDVRC